MLRSTNWRALLATVFGIFTAGQASAEVDAALLNGAAAELPAYLETLERLVTLESGSSDAAGLAAVADMLDEHLETLGFTVSRHGSDHGAKADTVVGVRNGIGEQRVLLMAHMDTVYEPGILTTFPFRVEEERVYGPGVADAKGGIAVILHSLELLKDVGWDDYATLTVMFNPDEEVGSPGSHELISKLGAEADTVLSFEPTWSAAPVPYYALLGHAAYAQVRLEITGKAGHASDPAQGVNAVEELAHQIIETRDIANAIPGAQLTWTNVIADQAFNQIPGKATAIADARITVEGADAVLLEALQTQIAGAKLVPGTEATVTLEILRPMFLGNDSLRSLVALADQIHRELGLAGHYPVNMIKGTSDAGYAALESDAAVFESLGPRGDGYHGTDEHIVTASIEPRLYLVVRLLMEIARR